MTFYQGKRNISYLAFKGGNMATELRSVQPDNPTLTLLASLLISMACQHSFPAQLSILLAGIETLRLLPSPHSHPPTGSLPPPHLAMLSALLSQWVKGNVIF